MLVIIHALLRPPLPPCALPLPPRSESRKRLDDALRSWASWHAAKFLPGYVPPAALSGSLAYQPDRMALGQDGGGGDGAGGGAAPGFAFEDRPAAPTKSGAETLWFNVSYEKVGQPSGLLF